ncbi:IscS subfamily cysteine desulfurase [Fictibacillus fluitans]|uniref:IscS subfamily cysteine desulfurase n=1 Tax=Fictibacillus fluitans TaxID=3058422 RepID=A0ABT8HZP7_9BACL|nr:IscS subfamily cysteine desulfurase [Fictibacillus sp. NE201]MDN4526248.1 IscS subfamily cysteine desulfurase [Fictibacillus sp. NE201]
MIYLDYAATTPMSAEAMQAYTETAGMYYANTSSLHDPGTDASDLVNLARAELARMLSCQKDGIYFTGGGSDGNFLALTSLAHGSREKGSHILTSPMEHSSVMNTLAFLENDGFEVTVIPVDSNGQITEEALRQSVRSNTIMASIAHSNSEIGITQNLKMIGSVLKEHQIIFHSDCVQTFGKLPVDAREMNLGALTVSAHKIHGPKGMGAAYISPHLSIKPLLAGVTHEQGFRQGTVNTPGIVSFLAAASNQWDHMIKWNTHVNDLILHFLSLTGGLDQMVVERNESTLPHFLPIRLLGMEGQYAMLELNRRQIAVSTGSACKAGQQEPSKALMAIGRSADQAHELVRITLGRETTREEITALAEAINELAKRFYEQTGS